LKILFFLLLPLSLIGQQATDSTQIFSLEQYLEWVRGYHPVMQQAALLDDKAAAKLLEAKGGFDPKLFGEYEDKQYDQKNYFRVGEAGLKIPAWFGVEFKLAYGWADGVFLNPANTLPGDGQAVAEIKIPLARGLLFDERRAQVQQANLYRDANEAARQVMVNQLLWTATEAYWQWSYEYRKRMIYQSALDLAKYRLETIKVSFFQGDKPAIDTVESLLQVQARDLQYLQAQADYEVATLQLSNYLWYEDLTPLEISDQLIPEQLSENWTPPFDQQSIERLNQLPSNHPELRQLLVKQQQLELKERLKKEAFKPQLDFNYAALGDGLNFRSKQKEDPLFQDILQANYKWGLKLSYPLLLRKARGGLEAVKIEQLELGYKLEQKQLELLNKINAATEQLQASFNQLEIQKQMLANYQALLSAENEKFRIGESSVFLLNTREQKLIEGQLKLIKLQTYCQQLWAKLLWAQGQLR